jgi:hypothetical protein
MFLVELSQNVIQQRIQELDLKNQRKARALKDSEVQLQSDDQKLLRFIERDQLQTHEKEKDADRTIGERKGMEQLDKELQMQIVNVRSEIEKQKDVVQGYKELGDFLMGLSDPRWVAKVKADRAKVLESFKREWIRAHKDDTRDDYIIFRGDDNIIFSGQKQALVSPTSIPPVDAAAKGGLIQNASSNELASNEITQQHHMPSQVIYQGGAKQKTKKGVIPGPGALGREFMSDKDWEAKFELLMSEDLIDLPPDLRNEELYFTDPNQMDEIFQELEERNLYLIHRKQEIEHTLET